MTALNHSLWSQVHVGDVVTVVKGAAADRSGTVKYIFRQFLFLHARRAALSTISLQWQGFEP